MKIFSFLNLLIIFLFAVSSAHAGIFSANDFVRYKVTVIVSTPEGEKIGSAVRESDRHAEMRILPEQGGTTYNVGAGEAVVVDLGKRGVLFALIGWQPDVQPWNMNNRNKVVMTPEQYPMFVRFKNLDDPNTVERVYATEAYDGREKGNYTGQKIRIINDMEKVFGKGIQIKQVSVETTNEPITWTIDKWLAWLKNVKMSYLNGAHSSRGAPLGLMGDQFQRGNK